MGKTISQGLIMVRESQDLDKTLKAQIELTSLNKFRKVILKDASQVDKKRKKVTTLGVILK